MAGPWRVRILRPDDPTWQALVAAGLITADGAHGALLDACEEDVGAVMRACGFLPWPTWRDGNGDLGAFCPCPQCGTPGSVYLTGPHQWTWNGSYDRPTLRPSILSTQGHGGCGGHYHLTDGPLTDCGGHVGRR